MNPSKLRSQISGKARLQGGELCAGQGGGGGELGRRYGPAGPATAPRQQPAQD